MLPEKTVNSPPIEDNNLVINESSHSLTRHQFMRVGGAAVIAAAALIGGVKYFDREPVPCGWSDTVDLSGAFNKTAPLTLPDGRGASLSLHFDRKEVGKEKLSLEVLLNAEHLKVGPNNIVMSDSSDSEASFRVDSRHKLLVNATKDEITTRCVETPKQPDSTQ